MTHEKKRKDGRSHNQLRSIKITPSVNEYAEGSVLIECGRTKIICTATIDEKQPPFLDGSSKGWITAEYSLLPRSTHTRSNRERGKIGGRTMEIQRLIGRSLRAAVDLKKLGPRQIIIDCDVIQADAGTRTASITGGFVAMKMAINKLIASQKISSDPILHSVAAVSVGIVKGMPVLDMDYIEDSSGDVDLNVVATNHGDLIEVQGTAEGKVFSRDQFDELLDLALSGIQELGKIQESCLG